MPLTFSHPAIILPFTYLPKKWYSLTGLIIGSLTPDFEYFLRMKIESNYSHTLVGIFWFDLPLGILLAFAFHNLVRNSLFKNLPFYLKQRVYQFTKFEWNKFFFKNWIVVIISLLIGAFSHVLWDSFTHDNAFFVRKISLLNDTIVVFKKELFVFKILQHVSTLIGAIIIVIGVWGMPVQKNINKNFSVRYWLILTSIAIGILTFKLINGLDYLLYGNVIVVCISAVLLSLLVTPILVGKSSPQ